MRSAALCNFFPLLKNFYGTFHCCSSVKAAHLTFDGRLGDLPQESVHGNTGAGLPDSSVVVHIEDFTANHSCR